jgi:hypothetical protein
MQRPLLPHPIDPTHPHLHVQPQLLCQVAVVRQDALHRRVEALLQLLVLCFGGECCRVPALGWVWVFAVSIGCEATPGFSHRQAATNFTPHNHSTPRSHPAPPSIHPTCACFSSSSRCSYSFLIRAFWPA